MRKFRTPLVAAVAFAFVVAASAQDERSLGDVARQTRLQRQRAQANGDGSNTQRVITNDEIPEHPGPAQVAAAHARNQYANYQQPSYTMQAEYLKHQFLAQKKAIARQEAEIERINSSIQYPGNCVAGCVQLNERVQQKQEQVERMKQMVAQMKANLEQTQEMARKQGYGSSVYDP